MTKTQNLDILSAPTGKNTLITKISARNLKSLQAGERGMMCAFLGQKPEEEGVVVFSRTQSITALALLPQQMGPNL